MIYANINAINSYLGMIKGTSDLKWAAAILDAIQKNGIDKDYKELKINYHPCTSS